MTVHWTRYEFHPQLPACVKCGCSMCLRDGREWSDKPEANVCYDCAIEIIEEIIGTVAVPVEIARVVRQSFLPKDPRRMRKASIDVILAAMEFASIVKWADNPPRQPTESEDDVQLP